jgi:hypothetical protein
MIALGILRDMPADERRRAARPGRGVVPRRAGDRVVRLLLTLTAVLAAAAAVVVVLGEDDRVLRLGVIAGLWATLLAVVALARHGARPDEAEVAAREAALRRTHELELELERLRVELERARLERAQPSAVPPVGRPWSSGTGARSVADLLAAHAVHDAGDRRRTR